MSEIGEGIPEEYSDQERDEKSETRKFLDEKFKRILKQDRKEFHKLAKSQYFHGKDRENDKYVEQLYTWSSIHKQTADTFSEMIRFVGLDKNIPKGHARIFRGVQWPWDSDKVLDNQYWIEDPNVALDYAQWGDIVVIDIPEDKIY